MNHNMILHCTCSRLVEVNFDLQCNCASQVEGHVTQNSIVGHFSPNSQMCLNSVSYYDCPVAIAMKHRQKEIREAEAELERYKSETDTLQAKLIEAEKILVSALHVVV